MRHRQKKRRKTNVPPAEVNITSLMDILTTLLFFILMVTSLSNFSVLDISSLVAGDPEDKDKKVFALQVKFQGSKRAVIELGPTVGLKIVNSKRFYKFLNRNFKGNMKTGYTKIVWAKTHEEVVTKLAKFLIPIKKAFPHEHKAIVAFRDDVIYSDMIRGMGSVREIPEGTEGFKQTNFVGQEEKTRVLFPQVILSEDG